MLGTSGKEREGERNKNDQNKRTTIISVFKRNHYFLAMGALALTFLACLSSSSLMSTEDEVHPESLSQNLLSTD